MADLDLETRIRNLEAAQERLHTTIRINSRADGKATEAVAQNVMEHLGDMQEQLDAMREQIRAVQVSLYVGFDAIVEMYDDIDENTPDEGIAAAERGTIEVFRKALDILRGDFGAPDDGGEVGEA